MNWNFKIQVNFLGFYFEVHIESHDIKTSIIMHMHYMNIGQSIAKDLLSVYKATVNIITTVL